MFEWIWLIYQILEYATFNFNRRSANSLIENSIDIAIIAVTKYLASIAYNLIVSQTDINIINKDFKKFDNIFWRRFHGKQKENLESDYSTIIIANALIIAKIAIATSGISCWVSLAIGKKNSCIRRHWLLAFWLTCEHVNKFQSICWAS